MFSYKPYCHPNACLQTCSVLHVWFCILSSIRKITCVEKEGSRKDVFYLFICSTRMILISLMGFGKEIMLCNSEECFDFPLRIYS